MSLNFAAGHKCWAGRATGLCSPTSFGWYEFLTLSLPLNLAERNWFITLYQNINKPSIKCTFVMLRYQLEMKI